MSEDSESECSEICLFIQQLVDEVIQHLVHGDSAKDSTPNCEEYSRGKLFLEQKKEENGFYHVDDLMQKWNQMRELKKWHYTINHIDGINTDTLKYHAFQVKWAKPMADYTHPIIVVNVYLFLKMKFLPFSRRDYSVEMSYNFEGNRFVRDARVSFNPKWLLNAYDDKRCSIASLSL